MQERLSAGALFDLAHSLAAPLFSVVAYPWEILPAVPAFVRSLTALLPREEYRELAPDVLCHRTARLLRGACVVGPAVIGAGCEVGEDAYLRGVLLGDGCSIGSFSEVRGCVFFDGAAAGRFCYVADSILGRGARFEAGVVTANLRADRGTVTVHTKDADLGTDMQRLGAMVGDLAVVGSRCVLSPGTLISRQMCIPGESYLHGEITQCEAIHGAAASPHEIRA